MLKNVATHYCGRNGEIVLVEERRGAKDAPIVIQSSGYTIDYSALVEPWLVTQIRTIPTRNRSDLADPFMFKMKSKAYKEEDCTVYTAYFLPNCWGIIEAARDLAGILLREQHEWDLANILFVGHSKGALLITEMLQYFEKPANVILISPTYPTLFGDEHLLLSKLEESKDPRSKLIKPIVKIIGSRRRVDYDMAPGSKFLQQLDIKQLAKHNVRLIVADCSKKTEGLFEKAFKALGSIIGLEKMDKGRGHDGMCLIKDQMKFAKYCKETVKINGCHQNSFNKSTYWITAELKKIKERKK